MTVTTKRSLIALLLSLVLVISLFTFGVSATESTTASEAVSLSTVRAVNSKERLSPPISQHPRENGGMAWEHHSRYPLFKTDGRGKHVAVTVQLSSE